MKRTVAKAVLLTSMILSAYSIVGAVVTQGKDGPMPACPLGCDGPGSSTYPGPTVQK